MKPFTTIYDRLYRKTPKNTKEQPTTFDIEKVHPAMRQAAAEWGSDPYMGIDKAVLQALGFLPADETQETDPIKLRGIRDNAYHEKVKAEREFCAILKRNHGIESTYFREYDIRWRDPELEAARIKAHVSQVAFDNALENCRKYPCKPVDKHTGPM